MRGVKLVFQAHLVCLVQEEKKEIRVKKEELGSLASKVREETRVKLAFLVPQVYLEKLPYLHHGLVFLENKGRKVKKVIVEKEVNLENEAFQENRVQSDLLGNRV